MIFDSLSLSDRLASVEVYADGVQKREDRDERESACGDKRDGCWFCAEVEESGCDGADVDREFELRVVSMAG